MSPATQQLLIAMKSNPVSVVPADNQSDSVDRTTYTFTVALGTADATRKMVVCVGARGNSATISSASIAGIALTPVATSPVGANANRLEMLIADVPTGTSGTLSITFSAGQFRCNVAVFAMYNAASSTPFDVESAATGDPISVNIDVQANGAVIAANFQDSGAITTAWTGLTEYSDVATELVTMSTAYGAFGTTQTVAVSADYSAAPSDPRLISASWS